MQCHLYDASSIGLLQKVQMMCLRIAFGVPWNYYSKTALKRLCCLEDMKCRNRVLNARFCHRLLNLDDRLRIPACQLWSKSTRLARSIANDWRISNPYYHRIISIADLSDLRRSIKSIRYENISQDDLGHTNISDAIKVLPSLEHSSILKWNGMEDAEIKQELIYWRLGRIAFHQVCFNCQGVLSRKHALLCSGVEHQLRNLFSNVDFLQSITVMDCILNHYFLDNVSQVFKYLFEAIHSIRRSCLAQLVD